MHILYNQYAKMLNKTSNIKNRYVATELKDAWKNCSYYYNYTIHWTTV